MIGESRRLAIRNEIDVYGVNARKRMKSGKRKRCVTNRQFRENGEVIGWCVKGHRHIRCQRRVRGGNY